MFLQILMYLLFTSIFSYNYVCIISMHSISHREWELILIQRTKRERNRQESKRVTRSLDHCIFCEIFCKIFDSNFFFCFVCFFLIAISFVSELLQIFLVFDSLVATQSINNLQESRLQALRENLRVEQQVSRACSSILHEINEEWNSWDRFETKLQ